MRLQKGLLLRSTETKGYQRNKICLQHLLKILYLAVTKVMVKRNFLQLYHFVNNFLYKNDMKY